MLRIILLLAILIALFNLGYLAYSKKRSYMKYALGLLVVLISVYVVLQQKNEDNTHTIVVAFNNNKNIICKDKIAITKNDFNLVSGTSVFLGKQKSKYNSYVIPVETCKVGK